MRAKRAVVSAPAKQLIFWALSANYVCISGENCEVEDFGLDKGSEFHGLSSIAQKNVQRAILLDECCQVMIDFIGRDLDRANAKHQTGNSAANDSYAHHLGEAFRRRYSLSIGFDEDRERCI